MIVEILDRRGQALSRQAITWFPVRIGRAYDNDVILGDPRADAHHAEIHRVGDSWRYDDCSEAARRPSRAGEPRSKTLVSGNQVRIGRTTLRFVAEGHPVAPTQRDRPLTDAIGHVLRSPGLCVLIVLAAVGIVGTVDFFEGYEADQFEESASVCLFALLLVALWAGPWAFANRSFTHEGRFLAHAAILCGVMIASTAIDTLADYISFVLLPGPTVSRAFAFVNNALFIGGLLLAHLSLLSHAPLQRRLISVAFFTLVTLGILEFGDWTQDDFVFAAIEFPVELKPIDTAWLPTSSPAEFFADLGGLQERVAELVALDNVANASN